MFIVFNTVSQANNYIKRNPGHNHRDGCGCCSSELYLYIDGSKVVEIYINQSVGHFTAKATVIGRIKKR
jgi:hypothetical protein